MLTHFKEAIGTWVHAKDVAIPEAPLGRLYDMVINPENGKIEAFWVKTHEGLRLLLPKDIVHWNTHEIMMGHYQDLSTIDQLPSLEGILSQEVKIVGANVYAQETKALLGTVKNFAFETVAPSLVSLKVEKGWGPFSRRLLIPHNRIVKMDDQGIFVNDNTLESSSSLSSEIEMPLGS